MTTTYEATTNVLRDQENFVVEPRNAGRKTIAGFRWWMPRTIKALTSNMLGKDEPDHRRLRRLVESAFVKQSVEEMRPRIASLAEQQLDIMEAQAERNGGRVDFMEHFARPFPLSIIAELLGISDEDRDKFGRWASAFTSVNKASDFVKMIPAIWKINRFLRSQFEQCRKQPRPGMISALVEAEHDGQSLNEEELLAMVFLLLFAGHETTVHLLDIGLFTLLQHPDQKAELLADRSKADAAVDEILRHGSSIQMTKPRYAAHDITLYGQPIKQGEIVVPLLAAANSDPAKFENPEVFDINRSPNPHVAFGTGIHVCLGLKLAKAEVGIALEKLFTRFPDLRLSVPAEEIPWSERIGHRAMKGLPVRLTTQVPSSRLEVGHAM
ncbi:cytochrome P450 family protein [Rubinisphaera brasiliensis]|uniref:cytochrome P450 family protein n=1 Tax=Rubinisphaera brasiliensis TaxID=119 RepID=UPI00145FC60E|nr:cytochrome P450 [Rubinisphaera brasiliensis]